MESDLPMASSSLRLKKLTAYLAADPENLHLLKEAADLCLQLSEFSQAQLHLQKALAVAPAQKDLIFKYGSLLLALSRPAEAIQLFSDLLRLGETHPAVYYNLAYAQFWSGQIEQARETLDLVEEPKRGALQGYDKLRARVLYHTGEFEDALSSVDRCLDQTPEDLEGLTLKSQLLLDSNRNGEAAEIAQQVLATKPDDSGSHLVLGTVALEEHDASSARRHLSKVIELQPTMGRALSALGYTDLLDQDIESATEKFESAVQHMPNHLGTWHGLAWSKILMKDFDGAQKAIDSAMALDRTFADNHGTHAVLAILRGQHGEAEFAMKRGLKLDATSASSQLAQALLASSKGNTDDAQRMLDSVFKNTGGMSIGAIKPQQVLLTLQSQKRSPAAAHNKKRQ